MRVKSNFKYLDLFLLVLLCVHTNEPLAGQTTRVSVSSTGVQSNNQSEIVSISADGRFLAFTSRASNLVSGDTNGRADIFLHDRLTKKTTRISINSAGIQGNDVSDHPAISANGRFIAFSSNANNLVSGDGDFNEDIFVRDRLTGKITRESVSFANKPADGPSRNPSISADGRFVAFLSFADNLVPGDTNKEVDTFVRDRLTQKTIRVNISSSGIQAKTLAFFPQNIDSPSISANGRFVAFTTGANNLVPGDTNGTSDLFVHDLLTHKTTRESVSTAGVQSDNFIPCCSTDVSPIISANGRFVAFSSWSTNLVNGDINFLPDLFVRDRLTRATTRVNVNSAGVVSSDSFHNFSINADGHFTVFSSSNKQFSADNTTTNVFIRDQFTGSITRASTNSAGVQGNSDSGIERPAISADGRFVAFTSFANNLVPSDTNGFIDLFVRDTLLNPAQRADLQLSVTSQQASVVIGQNATYVFTIHNNGPENASAVAITSVLTNGSPVTLTTSQGSCSIASVIVVCRLGTLFAGSNATLTAVIRANRNPLQQQLSVNAAPVDSAAGNNFITVSTSVTP